MTPSATPENDMHRIARFCPKCTFDTLCSNISSKRAKQQQVCWNLFINKNTADFLIFVRAENCRESPQPNFFLIFNILIFQNVCLDEFYHIITKEMHFRIKTGEPHVRAWPPPQILKIICIRLCGFVQKCSFDTLCSNISSKQTKQKESLLKSLHK